MASDDVGTYRKLKDWGFGAVLVTLAGFLWQAHADIAVMKSDMTLMQEVRQDVKSISQKVSRIEAILEKGER